MLENIKTDIGILVEEIGEQINVTKEELHTISDMITDKFGTQLSEHLNYVDHHAWEPKYDE